MFSKIIYFGKDGLLKISKLKNKENEQHSVGYYHHKFSKQDITLQILCFNYSSKLVKMSKKNIPIEYTTSTNRWSFCNLKYVTNRDFNYWLKMKIWVEPFILLFQAFRMSRVGLWGQWGCIERKILSSGSTFQLLKWGKILRVKQFVWCCNHSSATICNCWEFSIHLPFPPEPSVLV